MTTRRFELTVFSKLLILGFLVGIIMLVSILITGEYNPDYYDLTQCLPITEEARGFLYGLWHGEIASIMFVLSLFSPESGYVIYDVNNNGAWYNFGYLIGIGSWSIISYGRKSS